jgi:hypothetical protein
MVFSPQGETHPHPRAEEEVSMNGRHVNEDVEITVLPGEAGKAPSAQERRKIQKLIRDTLLLKSMEPYHRVQVEVNRRPDGTPEALVATMLRAYTYTADIVTVKVDADYTVRSIEPTPA